MKEQSKNIFSTLLEKAVGEYLVKHKYRFPKNYISFYDFAVQLSAAELLLIDSIQNPDEYKNYDLKSWLYSTRCKRMNAPIYAIKPDILELLLNTESGYQIDFEPALQTLCVLLPKNFLKIPNENNYGAALFIDLDIVGNRTMGDIPSLGWSLLAPNNIGFFSQRPLNDLKVQSLQNYSLEECDFFNQITNLIVQIFMVLTFEPELLGDIKEEDIVIEKSKNQVSRYDTKREKFLYPRWIGENYTKSSMKTTSRSVHLSPMTHWRKGHWRNQPCGTGKKDLKRIWIRPVLVNV